MMNDKDKNQFKMISTISTNNQNNNIVHNQLLYVDESDDLAYNEKRSAHNALERQRREGLNSKFQELAHILPSLRQVNRPSKSLIVAKSLEFVTKAEERQHEFKQQIEILKKENEQLMRQAERSKKRSSKKIIKRNSKKPCIAPNTNNLNDQLRLSAMNMYIPATNTPVTHQPSTRTHLLNSFLSHDGKLIHFNL